MLTAILSALLLNTAGAAETTIQDDSAAPPAEAFGRMPFLRNVRISPSGNRFFALVRPAGTEEYQFAVFEKGSDGNLTPIFVAPQSEEVRFRRPFWKRDDRIVFSIRSTGNRGGVETVETRLLSFDPKSGKTGSLFRTAPKSNRLDLQNEVPVQIQDDIVSYLADDPDHILIEYYDEGRNSVYQVWINGPRGHKLALRGREGIGDWYADGRGRVRSGRGVLYDTKEKLIVRMPDDKWKDLSYRVAEGQPDFYFLGFPHDPTKAYVASSHETDTQALYLYDIPSDSFVEQLFVSEVSDVYNIIQQRSDGAALGVTFAEDEGEIHWLSDNFIQSVISKVGNALSGYDVTLTSLNLSDDQSVFLAETGNSPGQYYLYDHKANALTALPEQYPELSGIAMGETFSTTYAARDGLDIPAYVTLPPGMNSLDEASSIPFIVLPHGGPNARTFIGFDYRVQFLVSRGYGVLQMNFRGSAGMGQEFLEAGDRQWGQAMQDDITDGTNWLIKQGHADADRIAILGNSYGGYAALMGAVKTPDLYQCAVAHAPVTDLPRLIRHESQFVGGKYWTRRIGRLWGDREMLRVNSPALNAEKITVPVLILHGENDRVVVIEQSERMVSGLKRQNKDYKYVVLPKGTHYLDVGNNRLTFLQETEAFLSDCLGK